MCGRNSSAKQRKLNLSGVITIPLSKRHLPAIERTADTLHEETAIVVNGDMFVEKWNVRNPNRAAFNNVCSSLPLVWAPTAYSKGKSISKSSEDLSGALLGLT